ncbi:TPA: hypothetical protein MEW84_005600 [Klebsiella pneumoniae]|nr:Uncharacterised protein [Klebsiella pneumoniae]SSH73373.1 Uncharacterised protein [Klebsiella pneumoniae]SSM44863.1 Uncharacterised protein [Klebsiella pneumoniae]HBV0929274.1 hypothetical protein [Klebsiella pneumoniae]HBW3073934.1 hypothetical protein [Klebsiella pneumoniae]
MKSVLRELGGIIVATSPTLLVNQNQAAIGIDPVMPANRVSLNNLFGSSVNDHAPHFFTADKLRHLSLASQRV